MTKYTDDQINEAIQKAAEKNTAPPVYAWEFNMYKKVIDHLPEPQDDWQQCAFEDIQKGDRVRMVQVGRTTDFHLPVIETHGTFLVLQDNTQCSNFHKAVYYRIPAPVQPDPKEHPVVIDGNGTSWFWSGTGDEYHSPERPGEYKDRFTNWTPGEVVPKVVETND